MLEKKKKKKYHVALPGDEYLKVDLSIQVKAAKVLYEIDFRNGGEMEICFSILAKVFRPIDSITKVIQECQANFVPEVSGSAGWKQHAMATRRVNQSVAEAKIGISQKKVESLEVELIKSRTKVWAL